jgi:hypothetical protein
VTGISSPQTSSATGSVRIASSLFDLQNLPINFFIGLFEASFQFGRNRALQVRSPVVGILRIPQS